MLSSVLQGTWSWNINTVTRYLLLSRLLSVHRQHQTLAQPRSLYIYKVNAYQRDRRTLRKEGRHQMEQTGSTIPRQQFTPPSPNLSSVDWKESTAWYTSPHKGSKWNEWNPSRKWSSEKTEKKWDMLLLVTTSCLTRHTIGYWRLLVTTSCLTRHTIGYWRLSLKNVYLLPFWKKRCRTSHWCSIPRGTSGGTSGAHSCLHTSLSQLPSLCVLLGEVSA